MKDTFRRRKFQLTFVHVLLAGLVLTSLSSCSSTIVRHLDAQKLSPARRDSMNHQFARAEVQLRTPDRSYIRKAGQVYLVSDTLVLRSSVLFDTLKLPLSSVQELHCFERMPLSTVILATLGGATAGFVVGKVSTKQSNADLPLGFSIIGGLTGAFTALISEKETLYLFDAKEEELAPPPPPRAPRKSAKEN